MGRGEILLDYIKFNKVHNTTSYLMPNEKSCHFSSFFKYHLFWTSDSSDRVSYTGVPEPTKMAVNMHSPKRAAAKYQVSFKFIEVLS